MPPHATAAPVPFLPRIPATRAQRQRIARDKLVIAVRALAAQIGGTPSGTQCRKAGIHVGHNNCFASLSELMAAAGLPRRGRGRPGAPHLVARAVRQRPAVLRPAPVAPVPPAPPRVRPAQASPPQPTTWAMEPRGWME